MRRSEGELNLTARFVQTMPWFTAMVLSFAPSWYRMDVFGVAVTGNIAGIWAMRRQAVRRRAAVRRLRPRDPGARRPPSRTRTQPRGTDGKGLRPIRRPRPPRGVVPARHRQR